MSGKENLNDWLGNLTKFLNGVFVAISILYKIEIFLSRPSQFMEKLKSDLKPSNDRCFAATGYLLF